MHQTKKSKRESENTRANYVNTNCNEMKCNFSSFSADGTLLSSNEQNGSATISRAHQTSAHTRERDTDLINTSGHPNEIENISCYILQLLVNVIRAPNQFTVIISL